MLILIWLGVVRMGAFTVAYNYDIDCNKEHEFYYLYDFSSIYSSCSYYFYSTFIYCLIYFYSLFLILSYLLLLRLILFYYDELYNCVSLLWAAPISLIYIDLSMRWLYSAYLIILSSYSPHYYCLLLIIMFLILYKFALRSNHFVSY